MYSKELANLIGDSEHPFWLRGASKTMAIENNFAVAYISSDNTLIIQGAMGEIAGFQDGVPVPLFRDGGHAEIMQSVCACGDECPYFEAVASKATQIEVIDAGLHFEISIECEFSQFNILKNGSLYCIAIVFSVDDIMVVK